MLAAHAIQAGRLWYEHEQLKAPSFVLGLSMAIIIIIGPSSTALQPLGSVWSLAELQRSTWGKLLKRQSECGMTRTPHYSFPCFVAEGLPRMPVQTSAC
jgi:hypothetical protein